MAANHYQCACLVRSACYHSTISTKWIWIRPSWPSSWQWWIWSNFVHCPQKQCGETLALKFEIPTGMCAWLVWYGVVQWHKPSLLLDPPPRGLFVMESVVKTVFRGMLVVNVSIYAREVQIIFPFSLRRRSPFTLERMWYFPDVEAGGKYLHLPLSMCPPRFSQ
jgi:hypothetical protein